MLTNVGLFVKIVFDNKDYRHHSKKATILRDRNAEQARIDGILLRKLLASKALKYNTSFINVTETENLERKKNFGL